MNPKVSIIVPIYNMEKYLSRCLDSLLSQSLKSIEIITVNDGSTDSTQEILETFTRIDSRIKVIQKNNGGVSSARNEGIKAANGDYIGFVDPDDWVNSHMYETMYNTAINENVDVVMCSYIREFGTHSKDKIYDLPEKLRYEQDEVKSNVMRRLIGPLNEELGNPELLDAWGTVWSKLYRKEIIKENNVLFVDLWEIGTNEDSLFNIHVFYHAKSFVFLNTPFYHYWKANGSSVTTGYKPNLLNQWLNLYNLIEIFLADKKSKDDYHLALDNRVCLNTLGLGLNAIGKGNEESSLMKIRYIKEVLDNHRVKRSFKQFELSRLPIIWRVFYFCAKTRFAMGFYLMLISIEILRKTVR
jgi:glycosyltransferase involved in cell wall biosynthesis